MSISEEIRSLASEGVAIAEIARRLNIRYQHAYNVVNASGRRASNPRGMSLSPVASKQKPPLSVEMLTSNGFVFSGNWVLSSSGQLTCDRILPRQAGVYAFGTAETIVYVGVATMGLAQRLKFYGKPGPTQSTNIRINAIIAGELQASRNVEIYTAAPPSFEWNELPVDGIVGLEFGLIRAYALPWNRRSTG